MTDSTESRNPDERNHEEPTVKVKDRRLLSEEERTGAGAPASEDGSAAESSSAQAEPPEAPEQPEAAGEEGSTETETNTEDQRPQGEEVPQDPTINEVLAMCVSMLAAHAWQRLGLQVSPVSNRLVKDLEEARVAIDSLAGLVEQLRRRLPPKEADELEAMLSNLRVNFVQQSSS